MNNSYIILLGKPVRKRSLRRSRRSWKDNIRMGVREMGWEDVDLIHLAEDRDQWWALVNTVIKFRVP
jgi:hypothetical protein